ncbi:VP5 [Hirame aquareovirus]|nr:VP5 [Hirame aquareovirus]
MGNVQTSTNVYNVNGDGNAFQPNAEMVASAAPAIDLKPGVLNPNGKLFVLSGSTQLTPENLILYVDSRGDYSYLSSTTLDTLNKTALDTNSWEVLFTVTRTGCGPLSIHDYASTHTGYVGANADDAALNGLVTDGLFISSEDLRNFKTTLTNRMQAVASWSQDLDQAMSLLTPDVMAGGASCSWKSILSFLESVLPLDNMVRIYPNEFYTVAIGKYPALKPGKEADAPPPPNGPLGEIASVMNAASSTVGLMSGSSAVLSTALDQITAKNLDLVSSDSPLPVATFTPSLAPRDYRPAFIRGVDAHWISVMDPANTIRVTTTLATRTYTLQIGPGPTKVLDMNKMMDAKLLLDISGMPIDIIAIPDFSTAVPAIALIETRVPYSSVELPTDIVAVSVIASSSMSASAMAINVRGESRLEMMHLQALFERETIVGKPYVYGLGCLLMLTPTSATTTRNPTLMDGLLTITPVLLRETTYKGDVVTSITPSDIMGNQTTEELTVALANDAVVLMENTLNEIAKVVGDVAPVASEINDTATSAIVSRLAIEETSMVRRRTGDARALPDFPSLWQKAKRAASLFVSDPRSALQAGIPILTSTGVIDAVTSAIGTTVRTGNIGRGVQDAVAILRARNSGTRWKQAFFKKVEELWPLIDG